ncbi:hypothetical protein ACSSS7_002976 [Eimeria intestinalis]
MVNLRDNTHLPCDRLREATKSMKNLERMADKRYLAEARDRQAFVDSVMATKHRGHPLRKDGIYTRYLWTPLHQRTIAEMKERYPQRVPTIVHEAREASSAST